MRLLNVSLVFSRNLYLFKQAARVFYPGQTTLFTLAGFIMNINNQSQEAGANNDEDRSPNPKCADVYLPFWIYPE